MRTVLLSALAASALCLSAAAHAGAGVSPFITMMDPDDLPASYHRIYDFSSVDAVYVMSEADAKSVTWRAYVSDSRGGRLIGGVDYRVAAPEVLAVTDTAVVSRTMVAIADDGLVQRMVDESLVGPCGHEPNVEGTVAANLMSSAAVRSLRGLSLGEPAVAVGDRKLRTTPMTALSASVTGTIAVSIINPDSMYPGGWCSANPTPHP